MQKENFFGQLVGKIKNGFSKLSGEHEDNFEDEFDDEIEDREEEYEDYEEVEEDYENELPKYKSSARLTNYRSSRSQYEIQIVKPKDEMAATTIIALLKKRNAVVVNMEYLDKETAKNILHYISGGAFALDGKIKKVSNAIFMVVPTGIELSLYERSSRENYDFGMKPWEKAN